MKMSKIAKICKSYAHVEILNESVIVPDGMTTWTQEDVETGLVQLAGTQWIGDGGAFYKMSGLPQIITSTQWARLYDVAESTMEKYLFEQRALPLYIDWKDYALREFTADIYNTTIGYDGRILRAVYATETPELLLINEEYLAPIDKLYDAEIRIRHTEKGQPYVCIRQEMELIAVIMPIALNATAHNLNMEVELDCMLNAISEQIEKSRVQREAKKQEEQENAEQSNFDGAADA